MRRSIIILLSFLSTAVSALPDDTLAVVGRRVILAEEFARRYQEKMRTVGFTDNVESRRGYLRNLVDDAIIIEHARRSGMDTTHAAHRELERIEIQELLTAYVKSILVPQARVSDKDLRDLYRHLNTRLRVRHLYARTQQEADGLARALASGRTFEALARETFTDPWLRDNGGSLGFMTVDEMDLAFERAAYALRVGEVSHPVRTSRGFSIIRVDEIVVNPLLTETEFAGAKERLARFARARAVQQVLKEFTQDLRTKLRVTFEPKTMERLWATNGSYQTETKRSASLSSQELSSVVVRSMVATWTMQDVLDELSKVPERHRSWVHSQEGLQDLIAGLMMQRRVCDVARRRGLDTTAEFREKVDFAFETFLLESVESEWKTAIIVSGDSVFSYFQRHPYAFQTSPEVRLDGILVDRASLADTVLSAIRSGDDFSSLARQYSIQRLIAVRGGDMGWFRRDDLGPLGDTLMTLTKGDWTGPLNDQGKSLFVRCSDVKPAAFRKFSECEAEIRSMLTAISWPEQRRFRTEQISRASHMEWHPERLPELRFSERVN